MADTESKAKNVVYQLVRASRCFQCDKKLVPGDIAKLVRSEDDREVLCRACAGLDSLEILRKGSAQITKLASKYSASKFVIVQWSELWKSYERVGLLLESQAIDRAEKETGTLLDKRVRQPTEK
jgi:hypothetical protein